MTEMRPSDGTYRHQVVRLADLAVTEDVITNITFENCTIVGPAVIVLTGGLLSGCVFEGPKESLFWPVGARRHVIGAIGLVDCEFTQCRFQRIAVAYSDEQEETLRREFGF